MSADAFAPGRRGGWRGEHRPTPGRWSSGVSSFLLLAATAVVPVAAVATHNSLARPALAACAATLLAIQWKLDRRRMLTVLVVWLVFLGLVRRLLSQITGGDGLDPLLLVAPVAWLLLFVDAVRRGALSRRTALTTAVLALGCLTLLGSVNTIRAPLLAGVAGLLFMLVPQLAFWVGRLLPSATLVLLLRVVGGLALAAAGYGLVQVFHGFLPWDRQWITNSGYAALNVGGTIRPFSTFSSAAEYGFLLGVGAVSWMTLTRRSRWLTVGAMGLLVTALVVASSRGVFVLVLVAMVVVGAARRGVRPVTALLIVAVALVLVPFVAGMVAPKDKGGSAVSTLVDHQVSGLANPFDPASSTLVGHVVLVGDGIASVVKHPLGLGIGATNIAGSRFGGSEMQTEADISNVAVALGLPGLVAFLVVLGVGLTRAYRLAAKSREPLALAAFGLLMATELQWLNGGHYAVAWLPWILLGWLDGEGRSLVPASADGHPESRGLR